MLICVSETIIRRSIMIFLLGFIIVASVFYALQNQGNLPGGNIALPKLFWLVSVIFCWFVIPFLLTIDCRLDKARIALNLFLLNMLARAVVELVMMFYTNNWHPYHGIGHDIFSLLLSLLIAVHLRASTPLIAVYLIVMAALFAIEASFAWYMLHNVHHNNGVVYYVPDEEPHHFILWITTLVVLVTAAYLIFFLRKWLYGTSLKS